MKEIECIVSGRVQMVMYLDFAQRKARKLGVVGTVQNLPDGTVLIVAQGRDDVLKQYLAYLNKGSVLSHIDNVSVTWRSQHSRFLISLLYMSETVDVPILYEDSNVLVVDKPAGLIEHPDGKREAYTLVDWVIAHYPEMVSVGEPLVLSNGREIIRAGIVHRLDRETSGVLLLARNQESFSYLKEQFQKRMIKKEYRAFLYGELKEKEGIIDRPIARSAKDFRLYSAQRGARGKSREAITHYATLLARDGFSYVSVEPKTGRTHQIRVHFKAINHPVICDSLYAPNQPPALGFSRLALHAFRLTFSPWPGAEPMTVEASLPADFLRAEKLLTAA